MNYHEQYLKEREWKIRVYSMTDEELILALHEFSKVDTVLSQVRATDWERTFVVTLPVEWEHHQKRITWRQRKQARLLIINWTKILESEVLQSVRLLLEKAKIL